jgi:hypothetical protein
LHPAPTGPGLPPAGERDLRAARHPVLRGISLSLAPGEALGILIGPSLGNTRRRLVFLRRAEAPKGGTQQKSRETFTFDVQRSPTRN